ncbi:MAG: DUF3795 domain-containing protein [Spirochaetia bacterium]
MNKQINMVAFCGLFCRDCIFYKGKAADLAQKLLTELDEYAFEKTAKLLEAMPGMRTFEGYKDFRSLLSGLTQLKCNTVCKESGGGADCKMRLCCTEKGYQGCWECADYKECTNLQALKQNHGSVNIHNLDVISEKGIDAFLSGKSLWYAE